MTTINTAKNKGGRPPVDKDDLRPNKVKVGFTDLEFDTVNFKAKQTGKQRANYIHDAALSARVRSHINDEQVELVRNMARMGNNLNQIAKQANQGRLYEIKSQCQSVVGYIETIIIRMLRGGDLSQPPLNTS